VRNAECASTRRASRTTPLDLFRVPHSALRTSERAVALVITLVLLSIITFMTVTFLVVSRTQHGAVATETDQQIARFAADTARERAIAELLAPILATTNEFNYGLLVSGNYITPGGFTSGLISPDPLNVNYYYSDGTFLKSGPPNYDLEHNLANLLYNPRAPVFVVTNALAARSNEFRFFLDLNRNGAFDPSGLLILTNSLGVPTATPPVVSSLVGDPQWIGGLQRPEFAHSASNQFTHRYAYLVVPAGQTLDLNNIYNDAKQLDMTSKPNDGFFRNQGVLAAEMNLAAFLVDLNTNLWPASSPNQYGFQYYSYNLNGTSTGAASDDAAALLRWRYNGNYTRLASVSTLLPAGVNAFGHDFIDGYAAGPLMTNTWWPVLVDADGARANTPWSGADNPNHFNTTQDLFDQTKTRTPWLPARVSSFTDRLLMAGTNTDTYNRYTFYRLLAQIGTDSAPEPGGKMNLNYCNVTNGYVVPNMATNFTPWVPTNFFMNAATRLLADAGYTVGAANSTSNLLVLGTSVVGLPITNLHIAVWPTNYYTPSVHRLLQLAANMYDATTNRTDLTKYPYLPTIFRPVFSSPAAGGRGGGSSQISIVGYQEVTAADTRNLVYNPTPPHDLSDPSDRTVKPLDMVYGIPLVIGAKKGFPNFNKLAIETLVQVSRKLQFHRPADSTTAPVNEIDQMYVIGVSNVLGVEAWNSYAANFPRSIDLVVWPDISVLLTNRDTGKWLTAPPILSRWRPYPTPVLTNIAANMWAGYSQWAPAPSYSFQIPFVTNLVFLTNMTYSKAGDAFTSLTGTFERTIGSTNFYIPPYWELTLKPRLRFALVDTGTQRIVDYVDLADNNVLNITNAMTSGGQCGDPYTPDGSAGSMWCTERMYGAAPSAVSVPTFGINNQIEASMGHITPDWNNASPVADKTTAINFFRNQFIPGSPQSSNSFNAPYQPFRNIYLTTSWQANDPLVHYTVGDLMDLQHTNVVIDNFSSTLPRPTDNLGKLNTRYSPWGGRPGTGSGATSISLNVEDPLMLNSDAWDFPTNKFPNPGWLGRVHRGTPWQTVYWKPYGIDLPSWQKWTGNGVIMTNFGQTALFSNNVFFSDAFLTQPTNDWHLLDLFTTALNDNATRGQLSINQTNLAAWSAALSGVIALTNNLDDSGTPITDALGNPIPGWLPIQPAGYYDPSTPATTWPPLVRLVNAINNARTNTPRHVFSHLSELLAVPELTVASPFLNTNGTPSLFNSGLNDAAYERLPQQIAGLLKDDSVPRFVIYAFGQTLKPESTRAIVKNGPFIGLCTNYQIVAEAATRTVVRFEGIQPYLGGSPPAITNLHPVIESFTVLPPD
jgi:hypothetical protein